MLYRAIFLNEVDILFKLRLFIQDLNIQIEKEITTEPISVFLANTIDQSSIDSVEIFRENRNLMTIQQFLFASTDQSKAIKLTKKLPRRSEEFSNLIIRLDFPPGTKCFTRTSSLNDAGMNVLINTGLITKVLDIEKDSEEKGYILMHLQVVSSADENNLQEEIQAKRSEIQASSPLFRLARLLLKVNQQSFAEQFFSNLLNEDFLISDIERQASLSQSLELLSLIHFNKKNFKRASELFPLCLKAYHRILPIHHSTLYLTYRDLAESFYRIAEYKLAIDYFQQALDTQFHSNNPSLFYSAYCCFKLSLVYLKQGNEQNAIQAMGRSEKILEKSGEMHHIELLGVYETLAENYYFKGKYDDAIIYYKKLIEIQQSIQPNDPKELYSTHFVIASIYLKKESYLNAMIYYERSFDHAREYLPEKHHTFVLLHNNLGYTYYEEKQYSNALNHYSKGLSLASECLGENHTLIGTLLSNTALVYANIERFNEAIDSMEKSIEQLRKTLPGDDQEVAHKLTLLDGIKRKKILHEIIGETFQYF